MRFLQYVFPEKPSEEAATFSCGPLVFCLSRQSIVHRHSRSRSTPTTVNIFPMLRRYRPRFYTEAIRSSLSDKYMRRSRSRASARDCGGGAFGARFDGLFFALHESKFVAALLQAIGSVACRVHSYFCAERTSTNPPSVLGMLRFRSHTIILL